MSMSYSIMKQGKTFEALILQFFIGENKDWEKDKDQFPDFYN